MQLSSKGRYAVMAMADLAAVDSASVSVAGADPALFAPVPVGTAAVSERQNISQSYLEQIFMLLRRRELVKSSRGPGGGYVLTRAPSEITIYEIMQAVDEPVQMTRCSLNDVGGCVAGHRCLTHDLWQDLGQHIRQFLQSTTLADVLQGNTSIVSVDQLDDGEDLAGFSVKPEVV